MFASKSRLKKRTSFTIMVIPHTQSCVSQFKMPIWMVGLAMAALITLGCSIGYLVSDWNTAKGDLEKLQHVETVNQMQAEKITDLIEKTRLMESKIAEVEVLDRQVREMVGLELDEEEELLRVQEYQQSQLTERNMHDSIGLASRGGPLQHPSARLYENNMELLETLDKDLSMLDRAMEVKQVDLNSLQHEVTDQLQYLEAIPDHWPAAGRVTSAFGYRSSPFSSRREFHDGLDIAASYGTSIYAAGTGQVVFSGWVPGYGRMVSIAHGHGYVSHYAHNSVNLVQVGDEVTKGERIARIGTSGRSTGAHVHFMIDYKENRIDPQTVLK